MITANAAQPAPLDDFNPNDYGHDVRQREAVRYLFFPGDVINPLRKEERQDLRAGGDEVPSRCLVRTKGYMRKCRITPLERWVDPLPRELMPEGVTPINMVPTSSDQGSAQGLTSFSPNLYGFPKYPGEEIGWITHAAHVNGRKGIVELGELFDIEWDDFDRSGIQRMFFPDFPYVPPTLREVEELINAHSPRELVVGRKIVHTGRIQSQMLLGCSQFRRWGTTRIDAENILLKIGTHKDGWTYTYSCLAEVLFPQLEMAKSDDYMHDQARFQQKLGESQEALTQVLIDAKKGDNGSQVVMELVRQFEERTNAMLQQQQDFMKEVLGQIFVEEGRDAPADPTPAKANNRPNKGGKRG